MALAQSEPWTPTLEFQNLFAIPRAFLSNWSYACADRRDLRLDLLRGFAVFVMIVDHFGGASWLYFITGNNSSFVSGAEAFVFISGLVAGIVYGGMVLKQGLRVAQVKALERALTLYKLTVILTLFFSLLSRAFTLPWADDLRIDNPLTWFINVVTLQQTFYLSDVMLLYTFLMALAAGALWLLVKRRTWVLLGASVTIWVLFQIAPAYVCLPWDIISNPTFNLAAWQLLFFVAMALGYHRDAVSKKLRELPRAHYFVLLGLLFLSLLQWYGADEAFLACVFSGMDIALVKHALFAKSAFAPGRLVASIVVFQFAYLAATLLWKPITSSLGWFLMPLGQNALYCYVVHIFFVGVAHIAFQYFPALPTLGIVNTGLQLLTLLLIWTMVQHKVLFNVIPR
jgi:hypothetical protein